MNPRDLPIWERHQAILDAVRKNPVTVIVSPTGTGKTTQVPRMLLEANLASPGASEGGRSRLVGVTQPRRIAATSVSERVAWELGVEHGAEVGYKIRFDDHTSSGTRLKFMTDGILLMEAQSDPDLSSYGVLVIDEAHERSVNIDFALGLLQRLLSGPRAADLKVVVMSATINPDFFVRYFGGAPLVEATAPMHPVEVRYQPPAGPGDAALAEAVVDRVLDLDQEETALEASPPGDVLVFLPGAGAIRRTVEALEARGPANLEVLPLFARLSSEEQNRVFESFPGKRKVVVATNIAETSITIDGVRWVMDSGLMKTSEFMPNVGVSRLVERSCSLASIEQRLGRAGRTTPGVCIRLFPHADLEERAPFARPEIKNADLSEVLLRLIGLGVRDPRTFPFPSRPRHGDLRAAFELLRLIDAIDEDNGLTPVGEKILKFPLPPRVARMIVEAAESAPDVVEEVVICAAFLSARRPYPVFPDRDEEARYRARLLREFGDPLGDVLINVRVMEAYHDAGRGDDFAEQWSLDPRAMRELASICDQLSDIAEGAGVEIRSGGPPHEIVRCMARAYPPFVLKRAGRSYRNRRLHRVFIHPESTLFHTPPDYIVAGEVMETSRMYARAVAVLDRKARKGLDMDSWIGPERRGDDPRLPSAEGRRRRKESWWERVGKHKHGKGRGGRGGRRRR